MWSSEAGSHTHRELLPGGQSQLQPGTANDIPMEPCSALHRDCSHTAAWGDSWCRDSCELLVTHSHRSRSTEEYSAGGSPFHLQTISSGLQSPPMLPDTLEISQFHFSACLHPSSGVQ